MKIVYSTLLTGIFLLSIFSISSIKLVSADGEIGECDYTPGTDCSDHIGLKCCDPNDSGSGTPETIRCVAKIDSHGKLHYKWSPKKSCKSTDRCISSGVCRPKPKTNGGNLQNDATTIVLYGFNSNDWFQNLFKIPK